MNDWFEWNGERCTVYGIHITEQPSLIRAPERVTYTNVPGRSGSLTTLEADDVYDDFILPVECTVPDLSRLSEIGDWLKGAGTLILASRPGGYYKARVVNQIEFDKVLRNHPNRIFTVNFRCQPFWYEQDVSPITITELGSSITNPSRIASEPVITVYGSGDITLMIGMYFLELASVAENITLDTPFMEVYSDGISMNHCMSGDFPTLVPGMNAISWSGTVTKIDIQPNWRYLI